MDTRMMAPAWQDQERLPDLSDDGRELLRWIAEHPHAPIFRNRSGHRLTAGDRAKLHTIARRYNVNSKGQTSETVPEWLPAFLSRCARQVPYYRQYLPATLNDIHAFRAIPTLDRSDLSADVARFVPDDLPLDRLLKFTTSGTTGHSLTIPTHPLVAAQYSLLHQRALSWHGIDVHGFDSKVAILLAGYQQRCFTYFSVVPTLGDKGLLKLNFHPDDWWHPDDRSHYLDALAPSLITGDPLSLHELAQLDFRHAPQALLSTSMAITDGQKARLEQRFRCPLVDVYSMNEAGPIAARVPERNGFRLLQPYLLVEILDNAGNALPEGERGEITLTGGFNDYLPLVRYRTGDHACLFRSEDGACYLQDLEGRLPVRFRTRHGTWINNIEITHALQAFPLPQYVLHQRPCGTVVLRVRGAVTQKTAIIDALRSKFGISQPVIIEDQQQFHDKVIQYTSELPGATP